MKYLFIALVVLAASSCSNDKTKSAIRRPDPFPAILSSKEVVKEISLYADRNTKNSQLDSALVYIEVAQDSVRASIVVSSVSSITSFEYYQPCALKRMNNHYVLVKYNNCLNTISSAQLHWINRHLINNRPKETVNSEGETMIEKTIVLSHPEVLTLFMRNGKIIRKTSAQTG